MEEPILNAHNKEEYPPMHTAEHILNGTMVKMFGCPRSRNAHIERKKSKCDYLLPCCPTDEQVAQLETAVNDSCQMQARIRRIATSLIAPLLCITMVNNN